MINPTRRVHHAVVSIHTTHASAHEALLAADALIGQFGAADTTVSLYSEIAAEADDQAEPAPATPVAEQPTPRKRAKPAAAPAPEPEPAAAAAIDGEPVAVAGETIAPADQPDAGTETTAAAPSDDDMRRAVKETLLRAPANRAKVGAMLAQLGVEAASHIPDGARPTFLAALAAL